MAMFVLVVDTSLMNVSISAVVRDLGTTVSGVQSAIALEALVSAAFILIGSKVADLIGRKLAYVIGLLAYAVGAISMTLAQTLVPVIIFWAIIGGIGASLLLPSMQSLIHGNFEGKAQARVYALVGASAAIAAAVGPLIGGFITTFLSWRLAFLGEAVIIAVVLSGLGLVKDVAYTGPRTIDLVGGVLSVIGMGGIVIGILLWQEGAERVLIFIVVGAAALALFAWWLVRRKRAGKPSLIDPDLFRSALFRLGISGQTLQQISLGGLMIVLPIYLQMVFEYNALQAGLSIAPLSLSMFFIALARGPARRPAAAGDRHPGRVRAAPHRRPLDHPDRAPGRRGLADRPVADRRWRRPGPARVAAQQLHALADRRGARERGGRRELRGRLVRAVVRPRVRRRDHARDALAELHEHGQRVDRARPRPRRNRSRRSSRTTPRS